MFLRRQVRRYRPPPTATKLPPTTTSEAHVSTAETETETEDKDEDEDEEEEEVPIKRTTTEETEETTVSISMKTKIKGKVANYKKKIMGQILPRQLTERKGEDQKTEVKREEDPKTEAKKILRNKNLRQAITEGSWGEVESMIKEDKNVIKEAINSDGNTMLHIAVGIGHNSFVNEMLSLLKGEDLPTMKNDDGSTALHIAAIVGNTRGADLLMRKEKRLLEISDNRGETPLDKAYENMHLDTIEYLLKAANDYGKTKKKSSRLGVTKGVDLLVNAVSAKEYYLATYLINKYPKFAVENDHVLMAISKTFPSELDYWETLIYPSPQDNYERIVKRAKDLFYLLVEFYEVLMEIIWGMPDNIIIKILQLVALILIVVPLVALFWILNFILLLVTMVYFTFSMYYFSLWKFSKRLVAPIKHIEKKKKEWEEAKEVLKLVCSKIDKLELPDTDHPRLYARPVLEAARQDAYEVVDEILMRSPGAIRYKDKSGYDIIQLAVIHRSEKIYNLIDILGERKSVYRMMEDSSKNNMLHLVGRLAPSHKLKLRTGAALQLQRELQWREEVAQLVFPAYITKENIFMETPDMVFTKEHENLVKEGEKWMKTVAESCSITAALITTIVFAAAITVPGGSKQDTGIPVFTKDITFTIFAVSDAISLFASTTALLMFQSILTGRFSEQDFLVSLPRRLIIGLCTLMISTTAMIVAFSTTLFIVFCHKKPWMLAPIGVLAFLPILSFTTLQIPLIVDLFRSTYGHIFEKQTNKNSHRFNPDDIRLFFGK
ncbi:unnamed protein product [Lactuca virosa]|uniref:PGG domain-containing protein n=1 Tax=Lactuca virosa TaxID=75947 RepID=A0AAU9MKB0_9ASTR|nr:unnamed protein product [Lactuca virosa]